jgi:hypothetical protein
MSFLTAQLPPQIDPFITYTYDKSGRIIAAHCTTDLAETLPTTRRVRAIVAMRQAQRAIDHARLESLFQ